MDTTAKRISRLEKDIEEIKRTLDRNRSMLRTLFEKTFAFLPLICFAGLACAVISLAYYGALRAFGSLEAIPAVFHWVFITLIAAAFVITALMKMLVLSREAKKLGEKRAAISMFLMVARSSVILHVFLPIVTLIVILCAVFISRGQAYYCVPICAIGCGLLWNAIGAGFSLPEYTVFGYWLIITGTASLFLTGIHALIWTAIIFGFGFICFSAYLMIASRKAGRRV